MERIQWVDGLRGIAAFIVAFNHFFCGEIKMPFRTFWAEPPEANRRIIQLPPIRFLWAMDAMVPLFMVISGYTVSHRLLKFRDSRPDEFIDRLRSSTLRRPIRLFLPLLALASFHQLAFYCGLHEVWFEERVLTRIKPWASPWSHVRYLCEYVMDMLNIFQIQWNVSFNGHLWTMPLEFRGSYVVYFVIFVQAVWRSRTRLWCLALMLAYLLWYGQWDIFCFIAGLSLAELRVLRGPNAVSPRWTACYIIRLAVALYLLCLSAEDDYPPDYRFLRMFQTHHWSRHAGWTDVRKMWHTIGAVLFFSAALESPRLQRLLTARLPQSLGRLSFPIYLIHLSMYQIWTWPLRNYIWWLLERREHPPPLEADQNIMGRVLTVLILSGLILGAVVIGIAELYTRFLDPQFARLTRSIEMRLSLKGHQA
ncbi:hypothetical protein BBP40_002274 [Aspergillus hancockii]|nr:hypothetical protein BBP40_002274 [Aspergillus hancockii]